MKPRRLGYHYRHRLIPVDVKRKYLWWHRRSPRLKRFCYSIQQVPHNRNRVHDNDIQRLNH